MLSTLKHDEIQMFTQLSLRNEFNITHLSSSNHNWLLCYVTDQRTMLYEKHTCFKYIFKLKEANQIQRRKITRFLGE